MRAGNTIGRQDAILMDAPWSIHAPKLLLWLIIEGTLIATGVITAHDLDSNVYAAQVCLESLFMGDRTCRCQTV